MNVPIDTEIEAEAESLPVQLIASEADDPFFAALVAAQSVMGPVPKSGRNPAFKTTEHPDGRPYSTLNDLLNTVRAPLTSNGLTWVQSFARTSGSVAVTTQLVHRSGRRGEPFTLDIPCGDRPNAQSIGTALSYGRRYSLMGACGVASDDDDDDGNMVSGRAEEPPQHSERRGIGGNGRPTAALPYPPREYTEAQLKSLRDDCTKLLKITERLTGDGMGELLKRAGLPSGKLSGQQLAQFRHWMIQEIEIKGGDVPAWAREGDPLDQRDREGELFG